MGKKGNRLTIEDRIKLQEMIEKGLKTVEIAKALDIHTTAVNREKRKCQGAYDAKEADENTCKGQHPIDYDIIGKKFGKLTVLSYDCIKDHRTWWNCRCDCGDYTLASRKYLLGKTHRGREISCGCIPKQNWRIGHREVEISMMCKFQSLKKLVEEVDGCWLWTGYVNQKSQCPMASWNNKVYGARRLMFEIFNHAKQHAEFVYAGCGERFCINPDHIKVGRPKKGHYN